MSTVFAWALGPMELALIAVLGVILFGRRLPEVGRYLGKGIVEFKKGMHGLEDEISAPAAGGQQAQQPTNEAIRPPQRVAATAPKFEDKPAQTPPQV